MNFSDSSSMSNRYMSLPTCRYFVFCLLHRLPLRLTSWNNVSLPNSSENPSLPTYSMLASPTPVIRDDERENIYILVGEVISMPEMVHIVLRHVISWQLVS